MEDNALAIIEINKYPDHLYNRLFPSSIIQMSSLFIPIMNEVTIDANPDHKEVYRQGNGYALTKIACLKLATAAGVVMKKSKSFRPEACILCVDIANATKLFPPCGSCTSPTKLDKHYEVSVLVPRPSGVPAEYIANKVITKADYKGLPEHMAAQCETKALLRAIRAGLGIKGTYTLEELKKPFVVTLIVPNTQDPEMRKAMLTRFATSQDMLFGGESPVLPPSNHLQLSAGSVESEVVIVGPNEYNEPDDAPDANDDIPPWEQVNDTPACCEVCHKPIEAAGPEWPVRRVVEYLMAKRGRLICSGCQAGGGQ